MIIDFSYFFHFSNNYENENVKSPLDKFYAKFDIELKSYIDHLLRSLKSYQGQEKQATEDLKSAYPNYEALNSEYKRLFSLYEEEHGGQTASQLASYESGIDQIDQEIHFAGEEIFNTYRYINDTFLKSSLIYLYSILEAHFRELCNILKNTTESKLDITELSNRNYLDTCYIYLSKVIGLDIERIKVYENTLKDFQNLRNTLVHDFGIVNLSKTTQIEKVLNSYNGIVLNENKLILNDHSILISFLQSIIMTFQELY